MDQSGIKIALNSKTKENRLTCVLSTYESKEEVEKAFENLKFLSFFGYQFQVLPLKTVVENGRAIVCNTSPKTVSEEDVLYNLRQEREEKEKEAQKIELENLRFELKLLKSEKELMETDMAFKERQLCSKENEIFQLKVQQRKAQFDKTDDGNSTNNDVNIFEHLNSEIGMVEDLRKELNGKDSKILKFIRILFKKKQG